MRKIISRLHPEEIPALELPIHVRSTGYNEADPGWSECEHRETKNFVQIFWTLQGTGEFRFPNRSVLLGPGEAMYRLPGEEHAHRSADPVIPWHYYWFTFDGEYAGKFMLSYGYRQENMYAGTCPTELFDELASLLRKQTLYSQRHAVSVATEIIARMGNPGGMESSDTVRNFIESVQRDYSSRETTVEKIAERLGIHRTTLTRLMKEQLKTTPKHYLTQVRLQKALSMLLETNLSVKAVAYASGFGKVDYFCGQVRRITGLTPVQYRKKDQI